MAETKLVTQYSLTAPVVMDFPNLFEARAIGSKGKEQGKPKYSANFIFEPDSEDLKAIKSLAVNIARARWPNRDIGKDFKERNFNFPWANGDKAADRSKAKDKDGEHQRGKVVLVSRSLYEPGLSGIENGKHVDYTGDARVKAKPKFYSGVLVLAQFNFQAYDGVGANPDGVTAYLDLVFTTNKGTKLAGGQKSGAEVFKGYVGSASTEDPTGGSDAGDDF